MPKCTRDWKDVKLKKMVKDNGYYFDHQTGSHRIFKDSNGRTMAIPKKVNCMLMRRLIKEYGLKTEV